MKSKVSDKPAAHVSASSSSRSPSASRGTPSNGASGSGRKPKSRVKPKRKRKTVAETAAEMRKAFLESEGCDLRFRRKMDDICSKKGICVTVLEPGYFDGGIIRFGKKKDGYAVVYDVDKLAHAIAGKYLEWNSEVDGYNADRALEDAYDWIDFNTVRSIPYMRSFNTIAPVLVYTDEEEKERKIG